VELDGQGLFFSDEVAEAYRAMDERRAIKSLLRPQIMECRQ